AGHLVEQGVNDLAVVQVDLARERAVGEMEHTGLPADADELDDVGEVKLGERSLEGHGTELNLAAPANCGREATKRAPTCQGQAGVGFSVVSSASLTARRSRSRPAGEKMLVGLILPVRVGGLRPSKPAAFLLHAAGGVQGRLDQ